ncbi:MAG: SRPBCC family protein [Candidatus Dormiibacterota bacterium]
MTATATSGTAVVTLPSDTEILTTREFNAPKDLVYKAWTTPELIKRWWAGDRGVATVAEIDLRVGGAFRYAMDANPGFEVAFHGEFREIVPNERLVSTEIFEGMPDAGAALNTVSFTEEYGRTTLTILTEYPSREIRDMVLASGMEGGLQESLDDLEEVAISLS